jgi:hypothetical protein
MIAIDRGVMSTQTKGCRFCLHVGTVAIFFGKKRYGSGARLEILTPMRKLRFSRGTRRDKYEK